MAKVVQLGKSGGKSYGQQLAKELQEKIASGLSLTDEELLLTKKGQGVEPLDPKDLERTITDFASGITTKALKELKPEKKKVVLVGFDRIASDMKKKIEKLARQKGISTFSIMGIPTRDGVPTYSGGMVGDTNIIAEGLYNMGNQRAEVRELLYVVVEALKDNELLKVTSISKLHGAGKVSARLFNTLNNEEIYDLKDLTDYTYGEVLKIRNMGEKSAKDLIKLLGDRGMKFKNFKELPK